MSIAHFRPRRGDWLLDKDILDEAVEAIESELKIDSKHDVPYTAGYSKDGKTVYIDKDVPSTIKIGGKDVDVTRYFMLHEAIEKTLLDRFDLPYQFAHQIALRVEQDAIEADGINWNEYNKVTMQIVKDVENRKEYPNPPKDLDLTPYYDEDDKKLIEQLEA